MYYLRFEYCCTDGRYSSVVMQYPAEKKACILSLMLDDGLLIFSFNAMDLEQGERIPAFNQKENLMSLEIFS